MLTTQIKSLRAEMIDRVRDTLRRPGVTARDLAFKAEIHRNTILGWQSPDWNPSNETLEKIEPHLAAISHPTNSQAEAA